MRILSINVGSSREITVKGRSTQTGIYKMPVAGPVAVDRFGLRADVRIEKRKMGLEYSAVYAYSYEHYSHWQHELGRSESFPMGQFGENLTVTGLLEEEVRIGDVFRFGNTVLQVTHPRIPCNKLNQRMGLRFAPMFLASRKVGYYLRVLEEGTVEQDDTIELLERDETSPTMEEFVRVAQYEYRDEEALQHLLQARDLIPAWREILEAKLRRAQNASGWHGLREFEVVHREQENEDTVSLYLKCAKGRALPPFHGGQQVTVVLGPYGGRQVRRPYALSGNPKDISSYRISVRRMTAPGDNVPDGIVSSRLFGMSAGERVMLTAPYGPAMDQENNDRIPVLISQGLGIAPMVSLLYEIEALQDRKAILFHTPAAQEPQGLLCEVEDLMTRNHLFQMISVKPDATNQFDIRQIHNHVQLGQAEFHIVGTRHFVDRLANDLKDAGVSPAALKVQVFN